MSDTAEVTPKRAASNSFTQGEIEALLALLNLLRSGGDVRQLQRSAELQGVERKFYRMRDSVRGVPRR